MIKGRLCRLALSLPRRFREPRSGSRVAPGALSGQAARTKVPWREGGSGQNDSSHHRPHSANTESLRLLFWSSQYLQVLIREAGISSSAVLAVLSLHLSFSRDLLIASETDRNRAPARRRRRHARTRCAPRNFHPEFFAGAKASGAAHPLASTRTLPDDIWS